VALYGSIELPDRPDPENVRRLDLLPIPMVRRIMRYGFRIDPDHFRELSSRLNARMLDLRADIVNEIPAESLDRFLEVSGGFDNGSDETEDDDAGFGFNVESGAKVAELLYTTLHLDRTAGVKFKKTKGGDRLSTGKKTLEQLKREHPVVPLILEYRENSKLESTYARSMPRRARFHPKGKDCPECGRHHWTEEWRIHTSILTTRTATGRLASKNPNLQNIPARSELGREIRAGFIASEGHVIAQRDFAQVELRLGADRSGEKNMLRIFADDGDIHMDTAVRAFNLPVEKLDKLMHRAPCKNVNFAVFYGITDEGLLDLMADTYSKSGVRMPEWMDKHWCADFIEKWFTLYPGIRAFLDAEESKARRYGIVWTATGRVRRIPEVKSYHSHIQSAGVRQGCNHSIQGFSADLMRLAMGEIDDRLQLLLEYGIEATPLMSVHDELLIETPEEHGETVQALLGEVFSQVLFCRQTGKNMCSVPIKSDGKLMERWIKE
jgi:DNA polymerase-1